MKHTKEQKQLINEWIEKFIRFYTSTPNLMLNQLEDFKKQHNLIDEELEVGKWYKGKYSISRCFIKGKKGDNYICFGMYSNGDWFNDLELTHFGLELTNEQDILTRLTWYAENVMKYNHEKPNYKCLKNRYETYKGDKFSYEILDDKFIVRFGDNANVLLKNGVWAETFEVEEKEKTSIEILQKAQEELNQMSNEDVQRISKEKGIVIPDEPIELLKPAYKSKGGEHGKRVIEKLVELGGKTIFNWTGKNEEYYYFIDDNCLIKCLSTLPQGYTECFLEEENQTITIKIPKGLDYKIEVI